MITVSVNVLGWTQIRTELIYLFVFCSFNSTVSTWCFPTNHVHLITHIAAIRYRCCREMNAKMLRRVERVSGEFWSTARTLYTSAIFISGPFLIVIMPPSALDQLTRLNVEYPMLFKLTNGKKARTTHAGVLEFVADEGKIYIPYWVWINQKNNG